MSDGLLAAISMAVLITGLALVARLHRKGLPTTYARDLVHVGAGIWVCGWPFWHRALLPVAIPLVALAAVLVMPLLRLGWSRSVQESLASGDERWGGIILYVLAYALFTLLAFVDRRAPAAAALWALALGDGMGGAVGRRFGKHFFLAPGAKRKSLEGSGVVALMSSVAALVAGICFGSVPAPYLAVATGVISAGIEALSPRGTDNLLLPLGVWAFVRISG